MSFLPTDYKAPSGGNYMKLQIGDNRFRILGDAVTGNVFWQTRSDGKRTPVRRRPGEVIQQHELETGEDGKTERPKHFWAMPVWDLEAEQVKILEITQRSVQDPIRALYEDPEWGDPKGYNLTVKRSGSGLDTEYGVIPGKPSPITEQMTKALADAQLDLEQLFTGGDPFTGGGQSSHAPATDTTPGQEFAKVTVMDCAYNAERDVTIISTSEGRFFTGDKTIGDLAAGFANKEATIAYTVNDKGGKVAHSIAAPQYASVDVRHTPVEEDDIPF